MAMVSIDFVTSLHPVCIGKVPFEIMQHVSGTVESLSEQDRQTIVGFVNDSRTENSVTGHLKFSKIQEF